MSLVNCGPQACSKTPIFIPTAQLYVENRVQSIADFDFESYSEAGYYWDGPANRFRGVMPTKAGLNAVGAPAYAAHPSTEIISLAYNLAQGGGDRLWRPGDPLPTDLFNHIASGGLIEAWNSSFEFYMWFYVAAGRMGWPDLPLSQLRCAMSKAIAFGLPGKLAKAADVLDAPEQKDPKGDLLIKKLSVPRIPTKKNPDTRLWPTTAPDQFNQIYQYNLQDIRAERAVSGMVPDLSPAELKLWQLDQRINARGVKIDTESLQNCISIFRQAEFRYGQELYDITQDSEITINKLDKLKGWMSAKGFKTPSLDKDHVKAALKRKDLPADVMRVLQIRSSLGAASVKKLFAIERGLSPDGRLRDLFVFCGARQTGRFAGMGPQPQNLASGGPDVHRCNHCGLLQWSGLKQCRQCYGVEFSEAEWGIDGAELALQDIATRRLDHVELCWGDAISAISGCLRALFVAADGSRLLCSDYSAIEAVTAACLAGETWRIEVFKTHGKIYETSAAKITGIPFQEFMDYKERTGQHHPMRKKIGKIAELASIYQGSDGAWKAFGADKFMSDEEILQNVRAWRRESPEFPKMWAGLEQAAMSAISNPGYEFSYNGITYFVRDRILFCRLLSGRHLQYHNPRLVPTVTDWGKQGFKILFDGWNSDSSKGPVGWMTRETFGGRLFENVNQATARDILTYAMAEKIDPAGYQIVLHVHDEVVCEVPNGYGSIPELEGLMGSNPPWCLDWPIKAAGGWEGHRYRKD
jgi:DNA polymerase